MRGKEIIVSLRTSIKNPDSSPVTEKLGEERPGLRHESTKDMEYNKAF